MRLRKWQQECLDSFVMRREEGYRTFVFEACPGAGKSLMAAELSWQMLNDEESPIDFVLVVVPWTSIQGDASSGMIKTFDRRGLRVRDRLMIRGARIVQQPVPANLDAVVTTYAEAMTQESIETLQLWVSKGLRIAIVFDEIHHANETNGTWGDFAAEAANLSAMTVAMSGTFFRSDGLKIKFVEYTDDGSPILHCPAYTYALGVADRVVRPVSCKYTDVDLRSLDEKDGMQIQNLFSVNPNDRKIGKIVKEVFHPEGECVRKIIVDVHEHLETTRRRFPNAGALFTCRPGVVDSSEDKHVHQIAQKIRQYTGSEVVVVTHHDRNAQGKIEAFRNGTTPYLVAVNMVSEGVDIPRLRALAIMRMVSSEMMFRQLVGRVVRMTDDEDGTAAKIFMPKFQVMHQFGMNLEGEALQGLRDLTCKHCGQYPCVCILEPDGLTGMDGADRPDGPDFEILQATPVGGGGSVSSDEVNEAMITIARAVMQRSAHHAWANDVQLAHALMLGFPMFGDQQDKHDGPTHLELLNHARRRVNRLINRLAGKVYAGDFQKCWVECLMRPFGVDWTTVKNTWTVNQIEQLADKLEERLVEAFKNGKN